MSVRSVVGKGVKQDHKVWGYYLLLITLGMMIFLIAQNNFGSDPLTIPPTPNDEYKKAYDDLAADNFQVEPATSYPIINDFATIQPATTIDEPKVTQQIYELINGKNPEQIARAYGIEYNDGKVRLVITVDQNPYIISQIKKIGSIEVLSTDLVQVTVDIDKINDLINIPEVKKIRIPVHTIQHEVISQGVNIDDEIPFETDFAN